MNTILNRLRARRRDENGNDVITSVFMLPLIIGLIVTMIDVSTYFQARSEVQNITKNAARTIALVGGNSAKIPLNNLGKTPSDIARSQLWDGSKCLPTACSAAPTVTCTPNIARSLNQTVTCTTVYRYQSAGGALVQWLGFGDLLSVPIRAVETTRSETYYR